MYSLVKRGLGSSALFTSATLLIICSALSYFPMQISHLADSGSHLEFIEGNSKLIRLIDHNSYQFHSDKIRYNVFENIDKYINVAREAVGSLKSEHEQMLLLSPLLL